MTFKLVSDFKPAGDQPKAIDALTRGVLDGKKRQTLLGVTGSGKTFTMANVIARLNKPTLILSPNKVLAAQLYAEFKQFFPENAVEYFISYYDYYQPEAYIPQTDTYIEKDSAINEHIDKLRLKATTSLTSRKDVIVVASVSCIYNIGSPDSFREMRIYVKQGMDMTRAQLSGHLIKIQYHRSDVEFLSGQFRTRGPNIDVMTPYSQNAIRLEIAGRTIAHIYEIHPITGNVLAVSQCRHGEHRHRHRPHRRSRPSVGQAQIAPPLQQQYGTGEEVGCRYEHGQVEHHRLCDAHHPQSRLQLYGEVQGQQRRACGHAPAHRLHRQEGPAARRPPGGPRRPARAPHRRGERGEEVPAHRTRVAPWSKGE